MENVLRPLKRKKRQTCQDIHVIEQDTRKTVWAYSHTVKFLNFWTPENTAVIYLKLKKRPKLRVFCQKDTNGIANSVDPDQRGAV